LPSAPNALPSNDGAAGESKALGGGDDEPLQGAPKAAFDSAIQSWKAADLNAARARLAEAAKMAPGSASVYYALGSVEERLGNRPAAHEAYKTALRLRPGHERSACAYAGSLFASKARKDATDVIEAARRAKPQSPRLLACAAELKSLQDDHASAQQLGQEALRIDPTCTEAMVGLARDHLRARRLDLARYALAAIVDGFGDSAPPRDKGNAEAHMLRGILFRDTGARAAALAEFDKSVAARSDLVEALVNLGAMRLEAGNATGALEPLERAVKMGPVDAYAHLHLGDAYRLLQRYGEAVIEFSRALELEPTLLAAHYDLGLMYLTASSMAGVSSDEQIRRAIQSLETYRSMRGERAAVGVNDEIDDLLARAKAKQAELRNGVAQKRSDSPASK